MTIEPDREAVEDFRRAFEEATGRRAEAEPFAFGDSPRLADELAQLVLDGPKRATAGSVEEMELDDEAIPAAGQYWIVMDGSGRPVCVTQTVQVRVAPLHDVDPAFAWDEGEGERTLEDWLEMHERYFRRTLSDKGIEYRDDLTVMFERFTVAWPDADEEVRLAEAGGAYVRELRVDERAWSRRILEKAHGSVEVTSRGQPVNANRLPGLVAVDAEGSRVGLLTFRPYPGGETEIVTVDVAIDQRGLDDLLMTAIREVGDRNGWTQLQLA